MMLVSNDQVCSDLSMTFRGHDDMFSMAISYISTMKVDFVEIQKKIFRNIK